MILSCETIMCMLHNLLLQLIEGQSSPLSSFTSSALGKLNVLKVQKVLSPLGRKRKHQLLDFAAVPVLILLPVNIPPPPALHRGSFRFHPVMSLNLCSVMAKPLATKGPAVLHSVKMNGSVGPPQPGRGDRWRGHEIINE